MPDHPSWPAELVEKVAAVLREPRSRSSRMDEAINDTARAVLSALSGDLVPRRQADALREDLDEVTQIAFANQGARSQADALAEALEKLRHAAFDYAQGGFQLGPDRDALAAALYVANERLASYRSKPAPGETK